MTYTFRDVLHNFLELSSVKGVPRIVKSNTRCLRVTWLFAVLFGMGIAGSQVYTLFMQYMSYQTVLSVTEIQEGAPFPDVTICSLNYQLTHTEGIDMRLDEYLSKIYGHMLGNPDYFEYLRQLSNKDGYFQNFNQTLFEESMEMNQTFVVDCSWSNLLPCPENSLRRVYSPDFHACYTLSPNLTLASESDLNYVYGLSIVTFLNDFAEVSIPEITGPEIHDPRGRGMKVIIHPHGTVPDVVMSGIYVSPGTETSISLYPTKRSRLDHPYGHCSDEQTLVEGSDEFVYSHTACESVCYQQVYINACDCLYLYEYSTSRQRIKYPFCYKLEQNISKTMERIECLGTIPYQDYLDPCQCAPKCHEYYYDFRIHQVPWPHEAFHLAMYDRYIKDRAWEDYFTIYKDIAKLMDTNRTEAFKQLRSTDLIHRNFMQLNVYFGTHEVKYNKDEPALTLEEFLANIGGALNLWVGITFITVIEVCELFYNISFVCIDKNMRKPKHTYNRGSVC